MRELPTRTHDRDVPVSSDPVARTRDVAELLVVHIHVSIRLVN